MEAMTHKATSLIYRCPCGAEHTAGAWAAAHWFEILVHTCDQCGAKNDIQAGKVLHTQLAQEDT